MAAANTRYRVRLMRKGALALSLVAIAALACQTAVGPETGTTSAASSVRKGRAR